MAVANSPTHLDPRVGTDQISGKLCQLLLNGLVTKNEHGNVVPDLAASWEVLDGGLRYRFHLRSGVRFHDGRPLTSRDVVWTYGSILDGTVATAKRAAFAVVDHLEAVDDLTVDLVLPEPFGALLVDLTPEQGIVPSGMSPEEMNRHPVGTGPFRFVSRTPELVVVEANPDYWNGPPGLERVVFKEVPDATVRALELLKGSVQLVVNDLAPDVVPLFRRNPHFQVIESPGSNYAYLGLNFQDPQLADPRVRRALALSIDRQRLVDTLWRGLGVVTETMLPQGLWATHEGLPLLPHDPAEARRLLDEAGYPDPDGDGPEPRLHLSYKTSNNETYLLQAQVIQNMAREAGIEIEVRAYEFATYYADVKKGSFQVFSGIRTGIVDPNIFRLVLHSSATPPSGQNRGRYHNPEFDRLIDEGARHTLPEDRRPYYLEAQEIFARELPYISLYTRVNYAVLPRGLEGYV
ncbi:MAG: ABC transporter substrate-binding protein, partial [Acidobacteria bacterium]|nr:ABC transporter substrate-binding protein [Acidobacteriota bacterium]